jgi:ribosome recycling factor
MINEVLTDAESRMAKAVDALQRDLATVRTGRATPTLLDRVVVDYYGAPTPINQMANVSVPEPRLLVIQPWDKGTIGSIEKAIQKSDVGINPMNDGKVIRLQIPPLSQERRKQLAARAKEISEEARISIRNIRRDANKEADGISKTMSEDDLKRLKDEIQNLTKAYEGKVDGALEAKTQELTTL